MWLLPTRGRPALCQDTLDACVATRMTSAGVILADPTERRQYDRLKVPKNWELVKKRLDLQPCKHWFLRKYPNLPFYGLLFDDLIPLTRHWDKRYEEAAGDWYMIGCEDDYLSSRVGVHGMPTDFTGAFGWGGKLVRTVGWWGFPGVRQAGNDNAWLLIAENAGVRRHLKDVFMEHRNWRTGKRPCDDTDNWVRDGVRYIDADFQVFNEWRSRGAFIEIADRIKEKMSDG